ncbi:hypothetical protein AB0L41_20970 [Amycolatopsis mediterranei]|uniref:hypothetical protein n=1 Tax=Amycolatopsis mediterranei TaxID=33910 RepID=UPI00341DDCA2
MDVPADGLLPGERLLWWGQPQRLTPTLLDWGQFAIGLLWGIAAVVIPLARHDPLSFFSWVVGVGGLASWGAVAARVRARRSVAYLVTDRRIVLADRFSGRTRASAYLGTLPPPVVRIRQDGSGTIVFRSSARFGPVPARSSVSLLMTGLVAVPEAGRVRDLIAWAQTGQA